MNVFNDYANYYDLLYAEKNYKAEAEYVEELLSKHEANFMKVLDIGCGTGKHADYLSQKAQSVYGIDLSKKMLNSAIKLSSENPKLSFSEGDVRTFSIPHKFEIITSLFHVFSYLNTNEDTLQAMKNVRNHLTDDGIFIFDFWYGPAVLTDPPVARTKELANDYLKITRFATPEMLYNDNVAIVNYQMIIEDLQRKTSFEIDEKHSMRYYFMPEIALLLNLAGLKLMTSYKWLTWDMPGKDSWNVICVCKKS